MLGLKLNHVSKRGHRWLSLAAIELLNWSTRRYTKMHYGDVIMGMIASQITSFTIVYSTVYSGANQRKHQSSASLAFVRGIHRGPVNSPHKWQVTRKMFPFDDVIMGKARTHLGRMFSVISHPRVSLPETVLACQYLFCGQTRHHLRICHYVLW